MSGDKIFDGSKDNAESKQPILENNSEGAAAWLNTDKNGDAYISVGLPLGLGSLNLFPKNDDISDALNQLKQYLDQQAE